MDSQGKPWKKVKVRLQGGTERQVENTAKELGIKLSKVYPMRRGEGYMGYGFYNSKGE